MVGAGGPVDIVFDPHVSQAIGFLSFQYVISFTTSGSSGVTVW